MSVVKRPLIVHIIYRLQVGGLENGLVNIINYLPHDKYRHAIVCLTTSSGFAKRINYDDVEIYELHKKEGKDVGLYFRLWKLLRQLKPDIVHSRNIATIESSMLAYFAGVQTRIHGEHGRDIYDVKGDNLKYQRLRRMLSLFIHCFVPMSQDLKSWLINEVRIPPGKIHQLYNGVDISRFKPFDIQYNKGQRFPPNFISDDSIIIGTVGRLEPIKDQLTLVKAFLELQQEYPDLRGKIRLVLLGDGSLRSDIEHLLSSAGSTDEVWLAGNRDDVAEILPALDIFVLPSLGEGISNTILEAMACQLPVIATDVGGNAELVLDGLTGMLVPSNEPVKMAKALYHYIDDSELRDRHGLAGRKRVEEYFSIESMVENYSKLYAQYLI